MDTVIKLNELTAGRDKLMRLLQYGSRTCWYYTQNKQGTRYSTDILKTLEFTFSSFRKLLRLGRCVDSLYIAMKIMKHPDLIVRFTLVISKMTHALFLLADHLIWVGRTGIWRINVEKWNKTANKFWLITIIANITRDIYEIMRIMEYRRNNMFHHRWMLSCLKNHMDVAMDTVKNACDLFIPLTALGITKCTSGTVGLLGVISSLIGLYTIIDPHYKLSPS